MRGGATLVTVFALVLVSCGDGAERGSAPTTTGPPATASTTSSTRRQGTTTAPVQTKHPTAVTARCRTVAFTPNSEDAASDITATGLSCADAEAFVRVAGRRTSAGGPHEVDVEGFLCVRTRVEQEPLPRLFYECTSGPRKVTFVRS